MQCRPGARSPPRPATHPVGQARDVPTRAGVGHGERICRMLHRLWFASTHLLLVSAQFPMWVPGIEIRIARPNERGRADTRRNEELTRQHRGRQPSPLGGPARRPCTVTAKPSPSTATSDPAGASGKPRPHSEEEHITARTLEQQAQLGRARPSLRRAPRPHQPRRPREGDAPRASEGRRHQRRDRRRPAWTTAGRHRRCAPRPQPDRLERHSEPLARPPPGRTDSTAAARRSHDHRRGSSRRGQGRDRAQPPPHDRRRLQAVPPRLPTAQGHIRYRPPTDPPYRGRLAHRSPRPKAARPGRTTATETTPAPSHGSENRPKLPYFHPTLTPPSQHRKCTSKTRCENGGRTTHTHPKTAKTPAQQRFIWS